jgi:hypothetical protein
MRARGVFLLIGATLGLVALAAAVPATARSGSLPNACSLITASQARSILGHPVRLHAGDTPQICVFVSSGGDPGRSTVEMFLRTDKSGRMSFAQTTRGAPPISGLGATAYGGQQNGAAIFYLVLKKGTTDVDLFDTPGDDPATLAQLKRIARIVVARL